MSYTVIEETIDQNDVQFVITEDPFEADLVTALRYATERMIAHRNVRGLKFALTADDPTDTDKPVLSVFADIPESSMQVYIEVRGSDD